MCTQIYTRYRICKCETTGVLIKCKAAETWSRCNNVKEAVHPAQLGSVDYCEYLTIY